MRGSAVLIHAGLSRTMQGGASARGSVEFLPPHETLDGLILRQAELVVEPCGFSIAVFGALPESYKPFKLDIPRAKKLLAEAGHPNGFSAELIVLNSFPSVDLAQHLQANAEKVGVKLKLTQMIGSQLFQRARVRNFEIYMAGYGFNYPDANNIMLRHAYNADNSEKSNDTISIAWRAGWDPGQAFNDAIRAAQVERDQGKRRAIYEDLQKQHNAASPIIYLFQRLSVNAVSKDVKVFKHTLVGDDYSSIEKR
jgi:peptide/nickel transport system substrate-binding protein